MKPFSDDDYFYKGFIYGMRLSNEGLMPVLDESIPVRELIQSLNRLDRVRDGITELMQELWFKVQETAKGDNHYRRKI